MHGSRERGKSQGVRTLQEGASLFHASFPRQESLKVLCSSSLPLQRKGGKIAVDKELSCLVIGMEMHGKGRPCTHTSRKKEGTRELQGIVVASVTCGECSGASGGCWCGQSERGRGSISIRALLQTKAHMNEIMTMQPSHGGPRPNSGGLDRRMLHMAPRQDPRRKRETLPRKLARPVAAPLHCLAAAHSLQLARAPLLLLPEQ